MKVSSAKVETDPVVHLPHVTLPPPEGHGMAPAQRHMTSKRSGREGRCELVRPGGATTNGPNATSPPAICQNSGGGQGGIQPGVRGGGGLGLGLRVGLGLALGLGSPSWWNQSWFYNPF